MNLTRGRLSVVPTITLHTENFHEVRLPTTEELLYLVALELKATEGWAVQWSGYRGE